MSLQEYKTAQQAPANEEGMTAYLERIAPRNAPKTTEQNRPHGLLTADTTEPVWNGYLLTVACPCGVVFGRWVTPWMLS